MSLSFHFFAFSEKLLSIGILDSKINLIAETESLINSINLFVGLSR